MRWIGWFVDKVGVGLLYLFVSFGVFSVLDIGLHSYKMLTEVSPYQNFFMKALVFGTILPFSVGLFGLIIRARIRKTMFPLIGFIAASLLGGILIALDEVYIALYL